jgi:hypothetical protein
MKHNWKENRFVLFAVFLYTAFYTLFNPKPALRILDLYEKGLIAEIDERMENLSL